MSGAETGSMVWITGLSSAGKTTVSRIVADRLVRYRTRPVPLDGDRIRKVLPTPMGYDERSRRLVAASYARLALELAGQRHLVLCSTVSMSHTRTGPP
jgi:adenylylsulfate kinase